ncbi:MAG: CDP-glucose 4,6-dehydratase [Lachnospiraceae bacterium]|nr:CDP-glucose 4,6-dehydratase [Lachnospiraceae bacterium]
MEDLSFFKGKKILITGHTGFKGSWMCKVLSMEEAEVTGYALNPPTSPSLYEMSGLSGKIHSIVGDVRDLPHLMKVFQEVQPEIVIHMAAQPIVRESYENPVYTYEVNVMGTVNVLECVRKTRSVRSFLNVTTDKVYLNREWSWGYRECEELNGYDPYSNSKSCSELVTSSYVNSFFRDSGVDLCRKAAISTARAGNVIGGGDFAADRIIPDCIRTIQAGRAASEAPEIIVRNPYSTRPYQHVLEPVIAYLQLAQAQYEDPGLANNYNVGPDDCDCLTTGDLVTLFCDKWNQSNPDNVTWKNVHDGGPHEANFLKLDCSRLKSTLGWQPRWHVEQAIEKIVHWTGVYLSGDDVAACMEEQIHDFIGHVIDETNKIK